jgi:hypothetical protein
MAKWLPIFPKTRGQIFESTQLPYFSFIHKSIYNKKYDTQKHLYHVESFFPFYGEKKMTINIHHSHAIKAGAYEKNVKLI